MPERPPKGETRTPQEILDSMRAQRDDGPPGGAPGVTGVRTQKSEETPKPTPEKRASPSDNKPDDITDPDDPRINPGGRYICPKDGSPCYFEKYGPPKSNNMSEASYSNDSPIDQSLLETLVNHLDDSVLSLFRF